ncbi:MAG: sensor histidine kinase [Xanthomonadales bacterium PRO7]|nr:sensor histidine kinase [Xanthomonadales bacterium PRO7]
MPLSLASGLFVVPRMKPLRPQLRGLIFKLTVFYVLLSLPCLVLVETGLLTFEFNRFMAGVERGSLVEATHAAANDLGQRWTQFSGVPANLELWSEALVLRLQRPHGDLLAQDSYILTELSSAPLSATVFTPDGRVLATAPKSGIATDASAWRDMLGHAGSLVPVADSPYRVRRVLMPIHTGAGSLEGYLLVELRLPVPWHRLLFDTTLEWPIVLGYLLVFGLASSFFLVAWVTRRLNRVARAATAWSQGDFSERIGDTSRDELGRLSAQLDDMALQLKDLLRSRAQLAALAERQRLARDLHDTVKQQAFALNLQLATLRRHLGEHPEGRRMEQAQALSQQIQRELALLLDELRAGDAELPFVERVRARAQTWSQSSGITLDLQLDDVPVPTPNAAENLLRIVDEALANVLRHSGATHVRVSLQRDATEARLIVDDNGRGADAPLRSGMGLANMRERAQALPQGRFEFDSATTQGTRIRIAFCIAEELSA